MSGTPKHSTASLSREVANQLRQQREEEAAAERRRQRQEEQRLERLRKEEQQRAEEHRKEMLRQQREAEQRERERIERERQEALRQQRLASSRKELTNQIRQLRQDIDTVISRTVANSPEGALTQTLTSNLHSLQSEVKILTNEQQTHEIEQKIRQIQFKLVEIETTSQRKEQFSARMVRMRNQIASATGLSVADLITQVDKIATAVTSSNLQQLASLEKQSVIVEQEMVNRMKISELHCLLNVIDDHFNKIDKSWTRFDTAGYTGLTDRLTSARQSVTNRPLANTNTTHLLNQLQQDISEYASRTGSLHQTWQRNIDQSRQQQGKVGLLLDQLKADLLLAPLLSNGAMTQMENAFSRLDSYISSGQFDSHQQAITRLEQQIETNRRQATGLSHLAELKKTLTDSVTSQQSCQFANADFRAIQQSFDRMEQSLRQLQFKDVENEMIATQSRMTQHIQQVQQLVKKHNLKAMQAQESINLRLDKINTLINDESAAKWARPELIQKKHELTAMLDLVVQHQFDTIPERLTVWETQLEQILKAIEETQFQEAKREYFVAGFSKVLKEMGFVDVQTDHEVQDNPFSATIIRAQQGTGKAVNIRVPQNEKEESVLYALEGFEMQQQYHQGNLVNTCDQAEEQLKGFHTQLKEMGIEMGELSWDDMPPESLQKAADELPTVIKRTFQQ